MNYPDVDDVLNYLSTKFNKIFCERDFVNCVCEDFQIILNNKNKCCVLVFPVLGPIYLKAVRYQAKIFDLAVVSLTCGKFKSVAVCNKNFIKKLESEELVMADKNEGTSRKKRPERQLYVPPAQRKSRKFKEDIKKDDRKQLTPAEVKAREESAERKVPLVIKWQRSKPDNCYLISTRDFIKYLQNYNFVPLNWHHDALLVESKTGDLPLNYLLETSHYPKYVLSPFYECADKLTFLQMIHSFILPRLDQPPTPNLVNKLQFTGILYPIFQFKNILNTPLRQPIFHLRIGGTEYGKDYFKDAMKQFDDFKNQFNVYQVQCKNKSVSLDDVIINMDILKYGHFIFVKYNEKLGYFYECSQEHNMFECYKSLKAELLQEKQVIDNITVTVDEIMDRHRKCKSNSQSETIDSLSKILEEHRLCDQSVTEVPPTPAVAPLSKDNIVIKEENTAKPTHILDMNIKNTTDTPASNQKTKNEHQQEIEIMRKTKEKMNRKIRPIMKYVDDDDTLNIGKNDNINNWEDLFDDNGQLQEDLFNEISAKVGPDATIVKASEDYSAYTAKPIEELEHIVEIYDFPSSFRTHDIVQIFSFINSECMYVKWVDDTHALLVLGTLNQARRAIEINSPLLKVRPMSAASQTSLTVAHKSDLRPAMKRPQTNLQTARRLITKHLGAKSRISKEQSDKESADLKAAREMKKQTRQNERDAWEGKFHSPKKD